MPRYLITTTLVKRYAVEADSPGDAVDSFWLCDEGDLPSEAPPELTVGVRRDPVLMLPITTAREFKFEYRRGGSLVFEHTAKRANVHVAREHAEKVETMLGEMQKSKIDEVRIRELSPQPAICRLLRRSP